MINFYDYITTYNVNGDFLFNSSNPGEFFSTSCVPGALSPAYNGRLQNPRMMCELCGGDSGGDFCAKNMDEPYYGNTGAFKCLVEKGEVAFTSHRAVLGKSHSLGCLMYTRPP